MFECVCAHGSSGGGGGGGGLPVLKFYSPLVTLFIASLEDEQMVAASERNVLMVQRET